ncbi:hypothetical protein [Robertkochia aurantiaca]|uniref:hypothetical protein n=1 Tax=Robertkochia aurantiaca TaxID=2873700 RepID=UPI001CCF8E48|nr:hypothetical protein [Robertkochia sp. 3YJGBD-33]
MKNDEKFCILRVHYDLIEACETGERKISQTEFDHIFTGRKKAEILKKISKFENRLRKRNAESKRSILQKKLRYLRDYISHCRHSYETLLRI